MKRYNDRKLTIIKRMIGDWSVRLELNIYPKGAWRYNIWRPTSYYHVPGSLVSHVGILGINLWLILYNDVVYNKNHKSKENKSRQNRPLESN